MKKTFALIALVSLGVAFADLPTAEAAVRSRRSGLKSAAANPKQLELQADLAERTRRLADQYSKRSYGADFEPTEVATPTVVEEESPAVEVPKKVARRTAVEEVSRPVRTEPVAQDMPSLPSSGFGISMTALALAGTAVLRTLKS